MKSDETMKKLVFFLVIAGMLAVWQGRRIVMESGPLKNETFVVIPRGASSRVTANRLYSAGVIDYPLLFRMAVRAYGVDKRLKAGEYRFEQGVTMVEAIRKMAAGEIFYRKITLPEGLTVRQIKDLLMAEPLLNGEITVEIQEGEILPETYSYIRGDNRDNILEQAKTAMRKVKNTAWEKRALGLPLKNAEELMVLASIIEKETGIPEERGLVASVFVNRLLKGMRLQTDPTVIYALTKGESELGRPLLKNDLAVDSPYNTYKYYGLPPAPICNPGREAIEAAANPEISNYLYFVASGNGGHNFASNLNQHNKNVDLYRKTR